MTSGGRGGSTFWKVGVTSFMDGPLPFSLFSTTAYHDIAIKNRNLLSFPFPSVVFILCVPVSWGSFINDVNPLAEGKGLHINCMRKIEGMHMLLHK